MTTVIYSEQDFAACDSKWACEGSDLTLDDHCINKYAYFKGNKGTYIAFFAGDEYPIVVNQAKYQGILNDNDYLRESTKLADLNQTFELLIVNETDGSFVTTNATSSWFYNIRYLGSGGEHAAQFFHYSKKARYHSIHKNNVVGALQYAYYKDPKYSGHPHNLRSWNPKYPIDDTVNNDHHMYRDILNSRLRELTMTFNGGHSVVDLSAVAKHAQKQKAQWRPLPPLKTSPKDTAPKVTVSSAISMLELLKTL